MRVSVTERQSVSERDLRTTFELAPTLALPWLIKLRYTLIVGEAALVLIAVTANHVQLPLLALCTLFVASLLSNVFFRRLTGAIGAAKAVRWILVFDIVVLTAELAMAGGPANPFCLLYLVEITLSAVVLSKAWTQLLGGFSIAGYGLLFAFHVPVPVLEGHHPEQNFSVHLFGMWIAFVVAALLITVLVSRVSELLREHEQERLRLQSLLDKQERIASLATLAAGAAHEMGTPLATIAIVAKELERYATEAGTNEHIASEAKLIRSEVERCGQILRKMGAQGAEPRGETPTEVCVNWLLQQTREGFPDAQRNEIHVRAAEGLNAVLPVETTRQVLAALVKNAVEASPKGKTVQLSAEEAGPHVLRFLVKDAGAGMSPEILQRITEPFFTTKPAGRGMGLGTFLVRAFADDLGGRLVFDSTPDEGTTAILELPRAIKAGQ
jgi:Signal transduction histidine kinase regulating C4-dicarboxylate transport system